METTAPVSEPTVRLVIADVDGTLVTRDNVLTPRAISAISLLRSANVLFAITSGRPPKGMKMIIDALDLSEPISAFNGGVIVNKDMQAWGGASISAERSQPYYLDVTNPKYRGGFPHSRGSTGAVKSGRFSDGDAVREDEVLR